MCTLDLQPHLTAAAQVVQSGENHWRLGIPAGPPGRYRLAQLDDYHARPRRAFPWLPPTSISLEARAAAPELPGTWGFGLWNDPFSMSLLGGEGVARWPTLPNAAWFFYAAPPNQLSLEDDLPHQGFMAVVFSSTGWSPWFIPLGLLGLPALFLSGATRILRKLARRVVRQDAVQLNLDVTQWHTYRIDWGERQVRFYVDQAQVLQVPFAPRPPLGLVLWIDNQYLALPADGRTRYGMLANPEPAWIELRNLQVRCQLDNHPTSE